MTIVANFFEVSYQDNYQEGEISKTLNNTLISTKTFKTIADAIKYFVKTYETSLKMEYIGDNILVCPKPMQYFDKDGFFCNASEKDIEDWKAGKIDLYNVEIQMILSNMTPVNSNEIESSLKMNGFI